MKSKNHVRTVSGKPSATSGGILGSTGRISLTAGQMTETQGAITHRTEVYDASFGIISSRF